MFKKVNDNEWLATAELEKEEDGYKYYKVPDEATNISVDETQELIYNDNRDGTISILRIEKESGDDS